MDPLTTFVLNIAVKVIPSGAGWIGEKLWPIVVRSLELHPNGKSKGRSFQVAGKAVVANKRSSETLIESVRVRIDDSYFPIALDGGESYTLPAKGERAIKLQSKDLPWPENPNIKTVVLIQLASGHTLPVDCDIDLANY